MTFLNFFEESSNVFLPDGKPSYNYGDHIIMDNAPIFTVIELEKRLGNGWMILVALLFICLLIHRSLIRQSLFSINLRQSWNDLNSENFCETIYMLQFTKLSQQ